MKHLRKETNIAVCVIPAKAGIQVLQALQNVWTPVFTGLTTCKEAIN